MHYDVAIVGAGPGGTVSAIALAEAGLNVVLLDKDQFPRHKLCGEFLSGEGVRMLTRVGLERALQEERAVPIRRAYVTGLGRSVYEGPLPDRPLSLSRYRLDNLLVQAARSRGVLVQEACGVTRVDGGLETGFRLTTGNGSIEAAVAIGAFGRQSRLADATVAAPPTTDPFVGFKSHFDGNVTPETVQLHAFVGGYCGIQPVENGRINACWITRASRLRQVGGKPENMLASTFAENPRLSATLESLRKIGEGFHAVSQLNFRPLDPVQGEMLLVGDAAGMIAPMCGDGISMAMGAGLMCARVVEAILAGRIGGEEGIEAYRKAWRSRFHRRMSIGRILHRAYMNPVSSRAGLWAFSRFPGIGMWLTAATRERAG